MKTDVVVIGGGFWGTVTAWEARRRGMDALLIDSNNPLGASRAAAGMSCLHWFTKPGKTQSLLPSWWTPYKTRRAFHWLADLGAVRTGEWFSSRLKPNPVHRPDCWMLPSLQSILSLFDGCDRWQGSVKHLSRSNGRWRVHFQHPPNDLVVVESEKVVIAAGAWSDTLLKLSGLPTCGVTGHRGRALVITTSRRDLPLPYVRQVRPYTMFTARPWEDGTVRWGDTVEKTPTGGDRSLAELAEQGSSLFSDFKVRTVLEGLRPYTNKFHVEPHGSGLVVATGGHRVGMVMSLPVAERALDLFKEGI